MFFSNHYVIHDCKAAYKPVSKGGWNAVKNSMAQAEVKGEEAMKAMENTK